MRAQRTGNVRTRSPPRAKIREREYSPRRRDIQEQHSGFVLGSVGSGREERGGGLVERRDYDRNFDGDRDGQLQKLSQFNQGLSQGESPSLKFQWKHLLAEPANLNNNANPGFKHVTSYGASRMSTEKEDQGSQILGLGGYEVVLSKHMSLEIERARNVFPRTLDVGLANYSAHADGRFSSPLEKSNTGLQHDEDFRTRDTLPRELYKEKEKPMSYLKDAYHYMMPSSQSETLTPVSSGIMKKNFPGSYNDGHYITSDGIGRTHEALTEPIGYDGYSQTALLRSSTKPELLVRDVTNYLQAQLSPTEGKHRDYTYPEVGRSERGDLDTLSDEFCEKKASVREDYGRDTLRASVVDPIIDRIDGNLHFEEDYGFGKDAGPWSYEEKLNRLPMSECNPRLYRNDATPHGILTTEGLLDLSEMMLKRKRSMDKKMNRHKPKRKLSSDRNTSHNIHDLSDGNEHLTGEDMEGVFLSNKSGRTQYKKTVRTFGEMASHRISNSDNFLSRRNLSVSMQRRLSKPHISAGRDTQKRLTPGPQNVLNPPLRNRKPYKSPRRRPDGFHGSLHVPGGDPPESKATPAKTDPPEDSEEFKKQVSSAFFKFVKQLNECPAQQRRYTEQGKAGSLKCSICGSNSKEFANPQSLAMHTFKSFKIGLRAQHMGFHKALCMLMGWNSAVAPNSSWVHMVLPDAKALALKEDLIIWPPIVIIQNSSIGNNDPDKRMIVTNEMLETIIRDMGFDVGKTKVCRGKPANQSIMVVKFNGIYSGLQEAEKLHKFYAENKHGRAELQQISSNSGNGSSGESQRGLVDKEEHVLYGYLGIAGDLDKLDFETKKWSVVKSKKQIQAIADAPLKTE